MRKQTTAIGLFVTATIAFEKIGVAIRDSQLAVNNFWIALIVIILLCFGWGWLVTFGVETAWPEFLDSPKEDEVVRNLTTE